MNSGNPDWRAHLSGSARRQSNQQHSRQASECFSAALALMEMGFWVLAPIFSEHSSGLPQHSTPALRLRSPVTAPVMAPVTPPGPGSTVDCHPDGGRCHSVQPQAIIINLQSVGVGACQPSTEQPNNQRLPRNPSATRPGRRMLFQDWLALSAPVIPQSIRRNPRQGLCRTPTSRQREDRQGETLGFPDSRPLSP